MRYSLGDNVATNPTPIGRVEVNYSDNKQVTSKCKNIRTKTKQLIQ